MISAPLNAENYCEELLTEEESEEPEEKITEIKFESIYFADFESFTKDDNNENI